MENKIHEGRNVKRFREMLGIKQDALAADLGDDWNQQKISLLEQKETIDTTLLRQISSVLKIPVEAFQNFDEEQAVNIIANTFHNGTVAKTVETIKNFDDGHAPNIIASTFHNSTTAKTFTEDTQAKFHCIFKDNSSNSGSIGDSYNSPMTYNPINK